MALFQSSLLNGHSHSVELDQVLQIVLFLEPATCYRELFESIYSPRNAAILVFTATAAAKFGPNTAEYEPPVPNTRYRLMIVDAVFEQLLMLHLPFTPNTRALLSSFLAFYSPASTSSLFMPIQGPNQLLRLNILLVRQEQEAGEADNRKSKAAKVRQKVGKVGAIVTCCNDVMLLRCLDDDLPQ